MKNLPHNACTSSLDESVFSLLKIATVPFYNAWPLTQFLSQEMPGVKLSPWYPAQMRRGLLSGQLDLAMMPVAELLHLPGFGIYGDSCIGARNEVKSVLLISRVAPEKIRTLALDIASRSSITLAGVMLQEFCGNDPQRLSLELDENLNACKADAFVVIGDRALAFEPEEQWEYRIDLAAWWREKTGLPFVFAAWIGRTDMLSALQERAKANAQTPPSCENESLCGEIARRFDRARDQGVAGIKTILEQKFAPTSEGTNPFLVSREVLEHYLTHSIHYRLGEEEKQGLSLFLKLAGKYFS